MDMDYSQDLPCAGKAETITIDDADLSQQTVEGAAEPATAVPAKASASAAAPASAVVRFRGCGGVCGCHRTSKSSNGLAGVDDRILFKNKLRAGCYEHLDDHLALANQASLAMKTRHQA